MTSVQALLLGVGAILALGAFGEAMFRRTGIPDVIWLVAAGVVLGPATGVLSRVTLGHLAPYLAAFTLVIIMFQGGVTLRLRDLARSAARSTLIAILGYAATVAAVTGSVALAVRLGVAPAGWTYVHGVLLGAILGGSSAIIVIPVMAQARVRPVLRDLLGVESTLTDILCVVFTAVLIDVLLGRTPDGNTTALSIVGSIGIAIAIGGAAGVLGMLALRLARSDHLYPVTLAALLGLYVLIDRAGGSPALGILTAAVVLGNASDIEAHMGMADPRGLDVGTRGFHQQMTFLIKTFFFVFLGAMLGPPWGWAGLGAGIGILLLLARVPAVYVGLVGSDLAPRERRIAAIALPRGLAAGVLAVLPVAAGVPGTRQVPVIVYSAVTVSIVLFAIGFRIFGHGATETADAVPIPASEPADADEPRASVDATEPAGAAHEPRHEPRPSGVPTLIDTPKPG